MAGNKKIFSLFGRLPGKDSKSIFFMVATILFLSVIIFFIVYNFVFLASNFSKIFDSKIAPDSPPRFDLEGFEELNLTN